MICRPRLPGTGTGGVNVVGDIVGRASHLRQILLHVERHNTLCAELTLSRLTMLPDSTSSRSKKSHGRYGEIS